MGQVAAWTVGIVVGLGAVVSAHEVTYKGTVVSLQVSRYAQPGGGFREVRELAVTVVDAKTKKPASRVFTILDSTRVLRAGKRLALADAAIEKGEVVEVVIDHDKPGDEAIEIRLVARQ